MRIFEGKRKLAVLLFIAVLLGLQLFTVGFALAEDVDRKEPDNASAETVSDDDGVTEAYDLAITNVSPDQAGQYSILGIIVEGNGFVQGGDYTYWLNLVHDSTVIYSLPAIPTSSTQLTFYTVIYGEPGSYDVVVSGAGEQDILSGAFTVTDGEPTCGIGGGSALLMLGLSLGLLSLAGSGGVLRRRLRKRSL
jgi:hypothetical protein